MILPPLLRITLQFARVYPFPHVEDLTHLQQLPSLQALEVWVLQPAGWAQYVAKHWKLHLNWFKRYLDGGELLAGSQDKRKFFKLYPWRSYNINLLFQLTTHINSNLQVVRIQSSILCCTECFPKACLRVVRSLRQLALIYIYIHIPWGQRDTDLYTFQIHVMRLKWLKSYIMTWDLYIAA